MQTLNSEELERGDESGSDSSTPLALLTSGHGGRYSVTARIAGLLSVAGLLLGIICLASPPASSQQQVDHLPSIENLQQVPAAAAAAARDLQAPTEPWQKLVCTQAADANAAVTTSSQKVPTEQWFPAQGAACMGRFQLPAAPAKATDYNGMALPDTCFQGGAQSADGHHHVFLIGDWGGLPGPIAWNASMVPPIPADHRDPEHFPQHTRGFVWGADDKAQQNVAAQMRQRASASFPDYILNVGDNFYWGGVNIKCGAGPETSDRTRQWGTVYEQVYTGPGIDGKQWLGVLGNHDFGGFYFVSGWDQAIMYSWQQGGTSTGRWVTPALYYSAKVIYPDFAVDYYFIDTNVWDTWIPEAEAHHNICSEAHNPPEPQDNCGITGPVSADDCKQWFQSMWSAEKAWLTSSAQKSQAEWQIVVTHFPPEGTWGGPEWAGLASQLGLDAIFVGHRHRQEVHKSSSIAPTLYVVSGGGGGITSENLPTADGQDDEYGFVDITLSREELMIEMISHGGQIRSTTCTTPRDPGSSVLRPLTGASLCAGKPSGVQPLYGQAPAMPFGGGGAQASVPFFGGGAQASVPFFGGGGAQAPAPAPPATPYGTPAYGVPQAAPPLNPIQTIADRFRTALGNFR